MKLAAWEFLNPFLLRLKKNKVYEFKAGYNGINLGCGLDNPSNWIGIDGGVSVVVKNLPGPIIKLLYKFQNTSKNVDVYTFIAKLKSTEIIHFDFKYGIPYDDATIPNIYSSHFFEHLSRERCKFILENCFRVMKKGGVIRICVPSLDEEVEKIRKALHCYDNSDILPIEKYVTNSSSGYLSEYSNHRWMYNFDELKKILAAAGFAQIEERSFREGRLPDVEILDTRGGLHVEGIKP
ncbi:methyltransferase domain-containing protein [bacterium]|nr:methyltransferase domain-containing protein [bacterium]